MFAGERDRETKDHGLRYGDIPPELRRAFDFYRDRSAEAHTSLAEAVEAFTGYMKTGVGKGKYRYMAHQPPRYRLKPLRNSRNCHHW